MGQPEFDYPTLSQLVIAMSSFCLELPPVPDHSSGESQLTGGDVEIILSTMFHDQEEHQFHSFCPTYGKVFPFVFNHSYRNSQSHWCSTDPLSASGCLTSATTSISTRRRVTRPLHISTAFSPMKNSVEISGRCWESAA